MVDGLTGLHKHGDPGGRTDTVVVVMAAREWLQIQRRSDVRVMAML